MIVFSHNASQILVRLAGSVPLLVRAAVSTLRPHSQLASCTLMPTEMLSAAGATCPASSSRNDTKVAPLADLAENLRRLQLTQAARCGKDRRRFPVLQQAASGNMRAPRLKSPRPPSTEDRRRENNARSLPADGSMYYASYLQERVRQNRARAEQLADADADADARRTPLADLPDEVFKDFSPGPQGGIGGDSNWEEIVEEAVAENGSGDQATVASGVSDDSPPVTPPGHLCPAGHTGDGGSELYISHSGEKEQQQNSKEGLRSVKGAGERSAGRTRRAAKLRSETQKQREKEKEEDAKEGLRSVKGDRSSSSTATWLALAKSVSGDGVDGPIVTVASTLA